MMQIVKSGLDVDDFDPSIDAYILVTKNEFVEMSAPLLTKIWTNVETTLEKANLKSYDIKKVLQVGGACKMPMIKKLLSNMFPNSEHCCDKNPDEVVAIGAAYYSYYLDQKDKRNCSIM
uniref:Heat shock protein 70 n=1 Tax=Panagrolaimus superbus TaxID=310955 RepID=A0A914Z937_9BILA